MYLPIPTETAKLQLTKMSNHKKMQHSNART